MIATRGYPKIIAERDILSQQLHISLIPQKGASGYCVRLSAERLASARDTSYSIQDAVVELATSAGLPVADVLNIARPIFERYGTLPERETTLAGYKNPKFNLAIVRLPNNFQFNPLDAASWMVLPEEYDKAKVHRDLITAIDKAFIASKGLPDRLERERLARERKARIFAFVTDGLNALTAIKKDMAENQDWFVENALAVQALLKQEWEELSSTEKRFKLLDLSEVKRQAEEDMSDTVNRFSLLELE